MNTFIRLLYAVLIAAAVVTFIGVGIFTFYPAPQMPNYPAEPIPLKGVIDQPASGALMTRQQQDYQQQLDQYQRDLKDYNRNISVILVVLSAGIVAFGLWLRTRSDIIAEGLQLGGIGTSIYAIVAASQADHRIMRFLAVTLFLASVIIVVYFKFNEDNTKKPAKKKA